MLVSALPSLLVSVWPASSKGAARTGYPAIVVLPADDEEDGDRFTKRATEAKQQRGDEPGAACGRRHENGFGRREAEPARGAALRAGTARNASSLSVTTVGSTITASNIRR